jgi:hypothetical protein
MTITVTGPGSREFTPDSLWVDPRNKWTEPGVDWGGLSRWINPSGLTKDDDPLNPGGTPTIFVDPDASLAAGIKVWLAELGIEEGTPLFVTIKCAASAGSNYRLSCRYFDEDDVGVGLQVDGTSTAMTGTELPLSVNAGTVPAGAAYLAIYPHRTVGTAILGVYEWKPQVGTAYRGTLTSKPLDPTNFWYEIIGARGEYANLNARLLALETTPFPASSDEYGRHLLRSSSAQIAKMDAGVAGSQWVIAEHGDSWIAGTTIVPPLRVDLQDRYGDAGAGFAAASSAGNAVAGVTRGSSGTWTNRDNETSPVGRGPDQTSTYSTEVGATKSWQATITDARGLYLVQPDGGSFKWRVDGGAWSSDVSTAGTLGCGYFDIPSQASGSHTIEIEVTVAGAAGVELFGVDHKILGVIGVRVHQLGNGGLRADQAAAVPAVITEQALVALEPHLIAHTLGTNDDSANIAPATFGASMTDLIDRDRAVPLVDVLLKTPFPNGLTPGAYTIDDYVEQTRLIAVSEEVACLDYTKLVNDYDEGDARGLYNDTAHTNSAGGRLIVNRELRFILPY